MSAALSSTEGDLLRRFVRIEQLLQRLRRASFLTIACVSGKAVGAGADISTLWPSHGATESATPTNSDL